MWQAGLLKEAEHFMYQFVLLRVLHHPAPVEPHVTHDTQHVHLLLARQLLDAIQYGDEAAGAPYAGRAVDYGGRGVALVGELHGSGDAHFDRTRDTRRLHRRKHELGALGAVDALALFVLLVIASLEIIDVFS